MRSLRLCVRPYRRRSGQRCPGRHGVGEREGRLGLPGVRSGQRPVQSSRVNFFLISRLSLFWASFAGRPQDVRYVGPRLDRREIILKFLFSCFILFPFIPVPKIFYPFPFFESLLFAIIKSSVLAARLYEFPSLSFIRYSSVKLAIILL